MDLIPSAQFPELLIRTPRPDRQLESSFRHVLKANVLHVTPGQIGNTKGLSELFPGVDESLGPDRQDVIGGHGAIVGGKLNGHFQLVKPPARL